MQYLYDGRLAAMHEVRLAWSASRFYRVQLVVALICSVLLLISVVVFLFNPSLLDPEAGELVGTDLQVYLVSAERLQQQEPLYRPEEVKVVDYFQYTPVFALAFVPWLKLPFTLAAILDLLILHIIPYGLLYIAWARLFRQLQIKTAGQMLARLLPLWLVFSCFWSDAGYLNLYVFLALLSTWLLEAVLAEKLTWAWLCFVFLLLIKPYAVFAAGVPLVLGRWRFFFKLVGGGVLAYLLVNALSILPIGLAYGWEQYVAYFRFLGNLQSYYPWHTPGQAYLGYNHSIVQSLIYFGLGNTPAAFGWATVIKAILLAPLLAIGWRIWRQRRWTLVTGMEIGMVLYLATFVWLDIVWEVTLGLVIFGYLIVVVEHKAARAALWIVFLPYALLNIWDIICLLFGGAALEGTNILADPSLYVPVTLIVILVFYVMMVWRLWGQTEMLTKSNERPITAQSN